MDRQTDRKTDGQTDRHDLKHYLPAFAGGNNANRLPSAKDLHCWKFASHGRIAI